MLANVEVEGDAGIELLGGDAPRPLCKSVGTYIPVLSPIVIA